MQNEQSYTHCEKTAVKFRALTEAEIAAYVASGEPMDKAGAYGIQGLGAMLVESIRGDYFTVMGLPVCQLAQALKRFGIDPLKDRQQAQARIAPRARWTLAVRRGRLCRKRQAMPLGGLGNGQQATGNGQQATGNGQQENSL